MIAGGVTVGVPLMVVDDDQDVRTSLIQVLQDEGYLVSAAANGRQALAALRSATGSLPRLILLDMMMPVMDGRAFLDEQARDARLAGIPVLILSAGRGAPNEGLPPILSVSVLTKPFALERLLAMVAGLCTPQ